MAFVKNNQLGDDSIIGAMSDETSTTPVITNDTVSQYAQTPDLPPTPEMVDNSSNQSESPDNFPSLFTLNVGQNDGIVPPLAPIEAQASAPAPAPLPAPKPAPKPFTLNMPMILLGIAGLSAAAWYVLGNKKGHSLKTASQAA